MSRALGLACLVALQQAPSPSPARGIEFLRKLLRKRESLTDPEALQRLDLVLDRSHGSPARPSGATRTYDVRPLVSSDPCSTAEFPSRQLANPCERIAEDGEALAPELDLDHLYELITLNVAPEIWESDKYSVNCTPDDTLVITAPDEVHEEVEELLRQVRPFCRPAFSTRLTFYAVDDPRLEAALVPGAEVSEKLSGEGVRKIAATTIPSRSGQQVVSFAGESRSVLLPTPDLQAAKGATLLDGLTLQLAVHGHSEAGGVRLELTIHVSKIASLDPFPTPKGEAKIPRIASASIPVDMSVPLGKPILVAVFGPFPCDGKGPSTLVAIAQVDSAP